LESIDMDIKIVGGNRNIFICDKFVSSAII